MGREIRRVPPNWQHPVWTLENIDSRISYASVGRKMPMFDRDYKEARDEWVAGLLAWERGERDSYFDADFKGDYWDWKGRPPDRRDYRPWKPEDATWFQLWETVSEGTPVSPPFATLDELAQYLAENGDEWDQHRGKSGWGIERARAFCADGWAPSMAIIDGKLYEGTELAALKE